MVGKNSKSSRTQRIASPALWESVFAHFPDATALLDESCIVLDANTAYARIFGLRKQDIVGKNFLHFMAMADELQERVIAEFVTELKKEQYTHFETFVPARNKTGIWVKISASLIEHEEKFRYLVTLQDVSDRHRIENGLRKSGEKQRSIFQSVSNGIIVTDMKGTVTEVNQKALEIGGFHSGGEVLGKALIELMGLQQDKIRQAIQSTVRLGMVRGMEVTARRTDGVPFFLDINISLLRTAEGEPQGHIVVMQDITARKEADEKLKASEDRLRDLFDNANDLIQSVDNELKYVYVNRKWLEVLGYTVEDLSHLTVRNAIKPDHLEQCLAVLHEIEHGGSFEKIETVFVTKDGRDIYVQGNVNGRFEEGKFIASRGIFRDVTETKRAEELYKTVVTSAPVGIYIVVDGCFRFVNPEFERITGYSKDELIGQDSLSVVFREDRSIVRNDAVQMLKGQQVTPHEFRMVRKDGEIRWAIETVVSINYYGSRATLGNFIDISQRKMAEQNLRESQERFSELARLLPLGVWEADASGRFTYFNDYILQTTGYSSDELSKMMVMDLVDTPDRENLRAAVDRAFAHGQPLAGREHSVIRKDSSTHPVIAYLTPIMRNGRIAGSRGLTVDITELKTMQKELQEKVKELEQANERLKELDKLKDGFLSTVSHELRTPLTSIKSFAEILLSYDEDRATQKEFLGIINDESDRLTRLINDFLDLSKIQSGRMQWQTTEVSIPWAVETAVTATSALFRQSNLNLSVESEPDLPTVMADKDRLVQVITNLLSNAQKFTPAGGKITVKAIHRKGNGAPQNPDMIQVSVADSGIGITPENHQRIFEKFNQVGDILRDRPRGTGLGLPISREIIDHYGGKMWVESELGKGSTFFFTTPVSGKTTVGPTPEVTRTEIKGVPGVKTILVVDDEVNIRRFISHGLTSHGNSVIEAGSGKEAIDIARKQHPDLILLDIVMPDLDGFDATVILKNDPQTSNIPILIVSVIEDKTKAYRLGANDYITKPFSMETLLHRIDRLLQGAHKTVLVVDDDKSLVKSMEYELRRRGFTTASAFNGKEAMQAVEKNRPDLILLDIKMPEMDGYEVIRALKSDTRTVGIRIVVMTGVGIDGGRVKALSIGATEYFDKGGGFDLLFDAVERILHGAAG